MTASTHHYVSFVQAVEFLFAFILVVGVAACLVVFFFLARFVGVHLAVREGSLVPRRSIDTGAWSDERGILLAREIRRALDVKQS